jgi:hypothetical protein
MNTDGHGLSNRRDRKERREGNFNHGCTRIGIVKANSHRFMKMGTRWNSSLPIAVAGQGTQRAQRREYLTTGALGWERKEFETPHPPSLKSYGATGVVSYGRDGIMLCDYDRTLDERGCFP